MKGRIVPLGVVCNSRLSLIIRHRVARAASRSAPLSRATASPEHGVGRLARMFQLLPASAHRRHPSARMSMRIRGEELDFDDQVFLYDGIPFTGA
ncbi:MAG TPA: hypothetical protein VJ301_17380 [Propionibacteriaceae bacterium]|nr:hypothetical protein [Propionibacteriaceae bacterium]